MVCILVKNIAEVDDLLKVCTALKLKAFQIHLIKHLNKNYIEKAKFFNDDILLILNLFNKSGLQEDVGRMMRRGIPLDSLDQLLLPNYLALDKPLRLELLKNSVASHYLGIENDTDYGGIRDIDFIFNFFDLIFHENRVAN